MRSQLDSGKWVDPRRSDIRLADYYKVWFPSAAVGLTPKSKASVESVVKSCLLPYLGDLKLSEIREQKVREWVAELSGRGLSGSRIRQAHGALSRVMTAAARENRLPSSPCIGTKLPRVRRSEVRFLTAEEVEKLVQQLEPPWHLFVLVLAYTGVRFGEAAALRRRRCDLSSGRLLIAEAATEVNGVLVWGDPKTHQHRTVAIPMFLSKMLGEHLDGHVGKDPDSLVFTSPDGGPVRYGNFRSRVWNPAKKAAGFPWLRVHNLRHTCATLLLGQGASVKDLQAQLGHADAAMTLNVYAGFIADHAYDLAARLDTVRASAVNKSDSRRQPESGRSRKNAHKN